MMKSELAEITNAGLPPADIEALKQLRNEACESTQQSSFTLQSQQRFLRRVLSPDSPARNLLMIHGTGTGKTCTAIQIAEEYILRPEFQDQKVMVIASSAVQDNFRTQLFDMQRVSLDTTAGILESKQCTGRRYLDMLLRIEAEPRNWNNSDVRDRLQLIAKKIVREFYEFNTYESFGEELMQHIGVTEPDVDREWIHKNFDNRLLIIDEAHNIRESKDSAGTIKGITRGMEKLVQIAEGLVLVLLTATPMYDTYDEIVFYMNLFLWNDRKQPFTESLKASDFFDTDAKIIPGQPEQTFRQWCQDYVSYVKGDNPFTFPFRLPPPRTVSQNLTKSFTGIDMGDKDRLKYISLVDSQAQGHQLAELTRIVGQVNEDRRRAILQTTVAVLPGNKSFSETFRYAENGYGYEYTGTPCLTPAELPNVSAKFANIIDIISRSQGIVLVYSNYVELGARLFSMALEEHGYTSAVNKPFLAQSSYTGPAKGKYITLTSDFSATELNQMIAKAKSSDNCKGELIKVIVTSPVVSEGVDFRNVRQIHILDPWWNMSRIEQVIGRGLRTCSHKQLDFQDQNCTVYLHVVRTGDGRECFDEYTYRTRVVFKAIHIAKVRKIMAESAMDCPLQNQINTLPEQWKALPIDQRWSEGNQVGTFPLGSMMAPMFDDSPDVRGCTEPISHHYRKEDGDVRPLSTYLDVRDEFLTKLAKLLVDKPIWDREDLIAALRPYTQDVAIYNLQQAVTSAFKFKDAFGRASVLESKGDFYALSPIGLPNGTVVERTTQPPARGRVSLPETKEEAKEEPLPELEAGILAEKRTAFKWPADARTRFSEQTLNGYIFDHVFTESERRAYLRGNPTDLPFVNRLRISENPDVFVLGKDVFEPANVDMVGDLNTSYREWTDRLLAKFIARKADLFASLSGSKFTIVRYEEKGEQLVREKQQKRFEPIICGTGFYNKEATLKLSQFIDERGTGTPISVGTKSMNKEDVCVYTELLAREEHNIFWLTPEELAVLYDGKGTKQNPSNQDRFTAEFKK